jgi:hypothetical protein
MMKLSVIVFAMLAIHLNAFYGLEEVTVTISHEGQELEARGVMTLGYHTTKVIVWLCPADSLGIDDVLRGSRFRGQGQESTAIGDRQTSISISLRYDGT